MSSPITYLQRSVIEPVLKPKQRVRVEPVDKYGVFEVPRSQAIEVLPPVVINLASYTSTLAAFSDTGAQTVTSTEVTGWDMPKNNLAQLRLVALDDVQFTVYQPAAVGRFLNQNGTIPFDIRTQSFYKNDVHSMLPEIFIFEDQTSPTITASPTSYRATPWARVMAFGFRYILSEVDDPDDNEPALTIRVEGS